MQYANDNKIIGRFQLEVNDMRSCKDAKKPVFDIVRRPALAMALSQIVTD